MNAPNVMVVMVDALRFDRTGPGGLRDATPALSRFAARSVVFEHTIAQGAWTVPSVASLFTSVDPQVHRALRYQSGGRLPDDQLSDKFPTLAESFSAAGYDTAALLKSVVLTRDRGFAQGFTGWRIVEGDMADRSSATQLTDAALEWITAHQEKPFFLYLHYMDPHSNYYSPEPYYSQAMGTYKGPVDGGYNQINETYIQKGVIPTRNDLNQITAFYDAEVSYWDSEFGRMMLQLVRSGIDANTIVVVMADHGEALYEHGFFFENHLFQENIGVPLMIKAPGIAPGRVSDLSQLLDVAPTLVDLAGLPRPESWQGRSLLPALQGQPLTPMAAYSEYGPLQALISPEGKKLMVGEQGPARLFDIFKDPRELRDIASGQWKEIERLKVLLKARAASWPAQRSRLGL